MVQEIQKSLPFRSIFYRPTQKYPPEINQDKNLKLKIHNKNHNLILN